MFNKTPLNISFNFEGNERNEFLYREKYIATIKNPTKNCGSAYKV